MGTYLSQSEHVFQLEHARTNLDTQTEIISNNTAADDVLYVSNSCI